MRTVSPTGVHSSPANLRYLRAKVTAGEKVLLRIIKDKVIVQRENLVIAECVSPPAEFLAHLRAGVGVAQGEIKSLQPISQIVEIGICD